MSDWDCTVCHFHPFTITLDKDRRICDRCAKAELEDCTPTAIVTRMEKRGILDSFSIDSFRQNARGPDVESPVSVMEYETENGNVAYCGFASLIPGCRTVQRTLGQAYAMVAMVAEAVDLRKQ